MRRQDKPADDKTEKPSVTLSGTVEKVIAPIHPSLPEKAQIAVEEADHTANFASKIRFKTKMETQ